MTEAEIARLALSSLPSFGPSKVCRSYSTIVDPNLSADEAIGELVRELSGGSDPFSLNDLRAAISSARRTVDHSENLGIDILAMSDERYPEPLKRIPKPAPFLHVKGALPEDWSYAVAVIGTREISQVAVGAIDEVVKALSSRRDVIVVSGLAFGADTKAHQASLQYGLRTVAVLAHGLDQPVYPRPNVDLAERILDDGGCWISELRVGEKIVPYNLVARDRLQSGLSVATIVAQTSVGGGSMHTALFTLQQRRTLIALQPPASATNEHEWLGNAFLIQPSFTPPGVKRADEFAKFSRPYARRLPLANITEFIEKALQARFIPKPPEGDSSTPAAFKQSLEQAALFKSDSQEPSPPAAIVPVALEESGIEQDLISLDATLDSSASGELIDRIALPTPEALISVAENNRSSVRSELLGSNVADGGALRLIHAGRIVLRPGYTGAAEAAAHSVRVSDTSALSRALSDSVAGLGVEVALSCDSLGHLSTLDVSFDPVVTPDVATALLRRTRALVSAVCVTRGYGALYDVRADLFGDPIVVGNTGPHWPAMRALTARDFIIPGTLVDLLTQFDDIVRMSSDLGAFLSAYALLDQLLVLWKRLSVSAKNVGKQRDIRLPEVRVHELKSLDATFSGRKYGDLLKFYKPLLKAAGSGEPRDTRTARRVLESALPRLLDNTNSAVLALEAAGGRIEEFKLAATATEAESLALALPLTKSSL